LIEFEGGLIPVIDPGFFFHNKPAHITSSACILVIEHGHENHNRRTGVLVEHIKEPPALIEEVPLG
jgi:chemotaxis signal transduction protein